MEARAFKLDHPHLRVWRASPALMCALPPARGCVRIDASSRSHDVDVVSHDRLEWLVARSVGWHCDWEQVFAYLVVRARRAVLYLAELADRPFDEHVGKHREVTAVRLERGDLIQLWPMAFHRMAGELSAISLEHADKLWFMSRESQERRFAHALARARR